MQFLTATVQLVTLPMQFLTAPMKLVSMPMQFLTMSIHMLTVTVQLATVPLKLVTKLLTFTTPVYDNPSQTGGELNKKLGPAERRASVKALWAEASFCLDFFLPF
jgi:hypothetical protein